MGYYVYILKSASTGQLYIGQTVDVQVRLNQHNDPEYRGTLHTKRRPGPWILVHQEECVTRREAMVREKALKPGQGRGWIKQLLVDCTRNYSA